MWWGTRAGGDAAPPYETATVDRGSVVARVTASGTLSALVTVQVGSQVSGRLQEILVDFNSVVKKGDVLARLDPQLLAAALEQARANHTAARANVVKAEAQATEADRQAQRATTLAERQLIARADAETADSTAAAARAQVHAARAGLAQAAASLHQAEVNMAYATIVSPIDGVVISRSVDVGQTVAATLSAPTLFVIAQDLGRMQVDTSVAEADVGKLSPGMEVDFTVDAWPDDHFKGTVRQIRNAATTVQNVVTYDAVIDVDNPAGKLRPGMTANVTFVWARRDDVVRIPNAALRFKAPAGFGGEEKPSAADKGEAAKPEGAKAEGATGGRASRGGRRGEAVDDKRTVWRLVDGKPERVSVQVGVTDGSETELVEGDVHEGDALITYAADAAEGAKGAGSSSAGSRGGSSTFRRGL